MGKIAIFYKNKFYKYLLCDDEDLFFLSQFSICTQSLTKKMQYPIVNINRKPYLLHRLLLNVTDPKLQIDHINHNTFDIRRSNLRIVTNLQNAHNKFNPDGKLGITYHKPTGKWMARIGCHYKRIYLGIYNTFEEAKLARDNKIQELNFINQNYLTANMHSETIQDKVGNYKQPIKDNNISGCPGVYWHDRTNMWRGVFKYDGKKHYSYGSTNLEEAIIKFIKRKIELKISLSDIEQEWYGRLNVQKQS